MAITIDEIANKAVPIPQEILDECACTGRLEELMKRRKMIKELIMTWYEQETTTAHQAKRTGTA